jgi:UDP-N-acetylbacillosamine N-acetyltransferase
MNPTASKPGALVIYGGGGHGLVVAEAAEAAGWRVVGFLDDQVAEGQAVGKWEVVASTAVEQHGAGVIVAIGENRTRARVTRRLVNLKYRLETIIHPTAWISPSAKIGDGVYIGPHAVVNARAHVADGAIINSAAVIEHHCRIGAFAHVAPNAALGGNVEIGKQTLVGIGAAIRPGAMIGDNCSIGAGAAVVSDIANGMTAVGVPAKAR